MENSTIIFDLDDTLTDYRTTNNYAMECVYNRLGLKMTDEEYDKFFAFECKYWKGFEGSKQEMDTHGMDLIDYVRSNIYQEYFGYDMIPLDLGYELMNIYINNLGVKNYLYDGVKEILEYLYNRYDMYIASSGPLEASKRKLIGTNIYEYFKGIVSAEECGCAKPKQGFYDYLFNKYNIDPLESVSIGDTLTTDILGGINNDMATIWLNRRNIKNTTDIKPDIEIHDIKELKKIL